MMDQWSVNMLAFNCANRTFADKRLAQGLRRSVFAFSSFLREHLDAVVKADQCAQNVDDIGIAANKATDFNRAVFPVHSPSRIKIDIRKVPFWSQTG